MKNKFVIFTLPLLVMSVTSCSQLTGETREMSYTTKQVDVYRTKDAKDKSLNLRFYQSTPHVPYISVKEYYKEFFNTNPTLKKVGNTYKYSLDDRI